MKVRKITNTDKPDWIRLRKALWPECPEARHTLEMEKLWSADGIILVAEDSRGEVVGFAEVSIRRDHVEGTSSVPIPYLEGWYVIPTHRGQGIGQALIENAAKWGYDAGFSELASDAEMENEDSIQAHFRLGFHEVGRSVHFVRPLRAPQDEPVGGGND
jgi:aminoglycoside 6'-N-acetyltransferase I